MVLRCRRLSMMLRGSIREDDGSVSFLPVKGKSDIALSRLSPQHRFGV